MLIENVIHVLKTKILYFLDRENVGEATRSKISKCKMLTFRTIFSNISIKENEDSYRI